MLSNVTVRMRTVNLMIDDTLIELVAELHSVILSNVTVRTVNLIVNNGI